jgi:hypothetical protein
MYKQKKDLLINTVSMVKIHDSTNIPKRGKTRGENEGCQKTRGVRSTLLTKLLGFFRSFRLSGFSDFRWVNGRGRDAGYPAPPRTDPYLRNYLIRLLPWVKRVDVPKDKDDRYVLVETTPQAAAPSASRVDCVSGSAALTLSTISSGAYAGMRSMSVRSLGLHNTAYALRNRSMGVRSTLLHYPGVIYNRADDGGQCGVKWERSCRACLQALKQKVEVSSIKKLGGLG